MSSAGIQSWSYSAIDNSTINGINIAENCPAANINNAIRQAMSSVLQEIAYQGADISASASMSLAGVDWRYMAVTGSASVIHVGTGRAGLVRVTSWNSPSTLVNSANMILSGAGNIVTATNDVTMWISQGSGAWRGIHFPVAGNTIADGSITTAKLADGAVDTTKLADGAVTFAKMVAITDGRILGASGGTAIEEISIGAGLQLASNVISATGSGKIVNRYYGTYSTNADLSTVIPADNSTPTSSEGTQVISLNVVTTTSTQIVRLTFSGIAAAQNKYITAAIFQGSTCIQVGAITAEDLATWVGMLETPPVEVVVGSATTTTFSVRVGPSGGSCRLNGLISGRLFGGTAAATLIADVIEP